MKDDKDYFVFEVNKKTLITIGLIVCLIIVIVAGVIIYINMPKINKKEAIANNTTVNEVIKEKVVTTTNEVEKEETTPVVEEPKKEIRKVVLDKPEKDVNPDEDKLVEFPMQDVKDVISKYLEATCILAWDGPMGLANYLGYELDNLEVVTSAENDRLYLTNISYDEFKNKLYEIVSPKYFNNRFYGYIYSVDGKLCMPDFGASGYEVKLTNVIKVDGTSNRYYIEFDAGEFDFPDTIEQVKSYITIVNYNNKPVVSATEMIK